MLMDWGVILFFVCILFFDGSVCEVLFGCVSLECYQDQVVFLGVFIGCYVNCIVNSCYIFDGEIVMFLLSQGVNQLYGGLEGFDKCCWQIVNQNDCQVLFVLSLDDGDQGFLGNFGVMV